MPASARPSLPPVIPPSPLLRADQLAWLALVLTPGLGPQRILRAFRETRQIERIFSMALTELESLGFPAESAQFIFDGSAQREAEKEWRNVLGSGAALLTFTDPGYPERLREIFDPPPVLWLRGDIANLSRPSIAVVGTRRPSPYGLGMSEMLSRDLASRKLVILSGMARGIDTAAHKGALAAGGITIAVWGTGVDVIYPKENKELAENIIRHGGTIISELPLGTFPAPQNFPKRNRIISGLSVGVLVVEAAENSGTRVTARCAIEQNRDVYAVPGNVTNKNSWGPNTLIKQGARLTATWEDVWEDLPGQVRLELDAGLGNESDQERGASLFTEPAMREQELVVYRLLRHDESRPIDEIMELLDGQLTSAEVFTALFELELARHIKQLPGKNYVRCM
jgi:DNA processing protein